MWDLKAEVRSIAAHYELPNRDKPASPCLSSRVQYGERITPEKLAMIEQAESFLKTLGIEDCRIRHHDRLARIEILPTDMPLLMRDEVRVAVHARLREIGYSYVALDLQGFRSGSMNEVVGLTIQGAMPEVRTHGSHS